MELSERKKIILAAIIKAYITTGEPVGSKMLCDILENAPSSATLRNEMNTLCGMGYLEQPHTSAGRIPTPSAYRFYVENLMQTGEISNNEREFIDSRLAFANSDPEHLPESAAKVLSDLTGLPVVAANISQKSPSLKRIELMRMGRQSLMVFVITSDGRSRSRLCHLDSGCDSVDLAKFEKTIKEKIIGYPLNQLTPAVMQNIFTSAGSTALTFMPLLSLLFSMISDINNTNISMAGQSNLFAICFQKENAENILSILNKGDLFIELIANTPRQAGLVLGVETKYSALYPSSMIFAKYGNADHTGCLCILGPNRMSYEHIMPSVKYTANRLSELLSVSLKDMEEQLNG